MTPYNFKHNDNGSWDIVYITMEDLNTKEHIKKIYDIIEKNGENIDKLTRALIGDSEFGSLGFRQRMEKTEETLYEHKVRMDDMDSRFNKMYQRVVGICVGVTIAASAIGWMLQNSGTAEANPIESVTEIEGASFNKSIDHPIIDLSKVKGIK